jgi:hypothetical protein
VEEVLRKHLGEIALLIYILYPLLKRWGDRRKEKREQARKSSETNAEAPERTQAGPSPSTAGPVRAPGPQPASMDATRPTEADVLAAARTQLDRLRQEASRQLAHAESDPRLLRLVPVLQEDLLDRLEMIDRSLRHRPTLSTIVQDTSDLRSLEALLRQLKTMAQLRIHRGSPFLAAADEMADACYAPMLDFARAQGLELRTSQPLVVPGDWELSIATRFTSTRVAPLRLPADFDNSLWSWPAIAHEVAHDFYKGLQGLDRNLHDRLGLPESVELPMSSAQLDGAWLRKLFGAWLPVVFADAMGTLLLGPANVETMRRALRNPASAQRTAAIFQVNGRIDEQPPARIRLYMATRVLHHLGRHAEADTFWDQWEREHSEVRFYYLPLGGRWVGLSDEALHSVADTLIDLLLQQGWPELDGFQLLNIPGLAYLHAQHYEVERLIGPLARGQTVDGKVRWLMAAAVLAAAAQPTLHDQILEAARRSIIGLGTYEPATSRSRPRRRPRESVGQALIASLGEPHALDEAIALAAAFTPYQWPRWR